MNWYVLRAGSWLPGTADREAAIRQVRGAMNKFVRAQLFSLTISLFVSHGTVLAQQPDGPSSPITIPTLCPDWLKDEKSGVNITKNTWPGYTNETLDRVEFVVNRAVRGWKWKRCPANVSKVFPNPPVAARDEIKSRGITDHSGKLAGKIFLNLPQGDAYYRTWSTPYLLPPGWLYHFELHRVPKSEQQHVLKSLATIERTILFEKFGHSKSLIDWTDVPRPRKLPFFVENDYFAHYDRVYDLTDEKTQEGFAFPQHWTDGLKNESLTKLWVECAIPIDRDWFPTGQPLRSVLPIALQTSSDLYLISQEVRPQRLAASVMDHFEGRVFDLSGSPNLDTAFKRVAESIKAELSSSFNGPPLSADTVKGMAPNQIRYLRRFQESKVLSKPHTPKYELSTYTILMWPGPKEQFFGPAEAYFDGFNVRDKPPDQVFLQISHSLQVSSEKDGTYPEPSPNDYIEYKTIVTQAIENSVARVTNRYHGTVNNKVGKIIIAD